MRGKADANAVMMRKGLTLVAIVLVGLLASPATGLVPAASSAEAASATRRGWLQGSSWAAGAASMAVVGGRPADANAVEGAFEMDMRFYAKQLLNGVRQYPHHPHHDDDDAPSDATGRGPPPPPPPPATTHHHPRTTRRPSDLRTTPQSRRGPSTARPPS